MYVYVTYSLHVTSMDLWHVWETSIVTCNRKTWKLTWNAVSEVFENIFTKNVSETPSDYVQIKSFRISETVQSVLVWVPFNSLEHF